MIDNDDLHNEVNAVKIEIKELRTTMIGIDGKNGIRGNLAILKNDYEAFKGTMQEDKYRHRENCYGVELVQKLREEIKEQATEDAAKMQIDAETRTALLTIAENSRSKKRTDIITFIGIVLVFFAAIWDKLPWA